MTSKRLVLCIVTLFCIGAVLSTTAQSPEAAIATLNLGDVITGSLMPDEQHHYALNLTEADLPVDIVLFAVQDGSLVSFNTRGRRIDNSDSMLGYGYETITIKTVAAIPADLVVRFFSITSAAEYTLSILPPEQAITEEPILGEQVKRWAELPAGANSSRTVQLPYLLYLPADYDPAQTYPFILFMHGLGESGPRLDYVKSQVIPELIEEGQDFPFIIASPHLNYGESWDMKTYQLAELIASLQADFPVDPDRIYVTGLSLGGSGVWSFAVAYPDVPAALFSAGGFYTFEVPSVPPNICEISEIPIWVVHSKADEVVSIELESVIVDAIRDCGGNVEFTIYEDATHDQTFDRAFNDPALYEWLLAQHK